MIAIVQNWRHGLAPERGIAFASQAHPGRRSAFFAAGLAGVGGVAGPAAAEYATEERRKGVYDNKAKQLNEAVDWILFELRPLVFPSSRVLEQDACEEENPDGCLEASVLGNAGDLFRPVGASRTGAVVLSKPERDVYFPLKTLAFSAVLDPDTSDDLSEIYDKIELSAEKFGIEARRRNLGTSRNYFAEFTGLMNTYFDKVNQATGLPKEAPTYLTPIPANQEVIDSDPYWVKRQRKWLVKKKVDRTSIQSKTARFYAKSIFGEDAESWDPRGDRASEYSLAAQS